MKIKTLKGIKEEEILNAFNASFSDYFVPFHLNLKQLQSKMVADSIDLNLSVGVFYNNNLTAFILHGSKKTTTETLIYNGGTGVIPEKRGNGLTKQMYDYILPILKEKGISALFLEVISENIKAIKSYQKAGFKITRNLNCFKGVLKTLEPNNEFIIKPLKDYNWKLLHSFWDILPTWQNSKETVNTLKNSNFSLGAYAENELIGYIIYNPTSRRLQQIAISKNYRKKKVATTLLYEVSKKYGNSISVINIDSNSKATTCFFETIGLQKFLAQKEMKLMIQ